MNEMLYRVDQFYTGDFAQIMTGVYNLRWRKDLGKEITAKSPLFTSRTNRGNQAVTQQMITLMLHGVAKKAGLNGDWKYGILRAHSFRKFFITQMTNHGVQDKVVDFLVGHAVSEIDGVYWARRVEELRKIYADSQQHLNPISFKQEYDLSKIEGLQAKIAELENQILEFKKPETQKPSFDVKIVTSEEEIIQLVSQGWECQSIGIDKWLMKRKR